MKDLFRLVTALLILSILVSGVVSCGSRSDGAGACQDFSIVWNVVDNGDYTDAEARAFATGFTEECENIFEDCTVSEAEREFNEFCRYLDDEFKSGYKKLALQANLIPADGHDVLATETFHIDPDTAGDKNRSLWWSRFKLWVKYNLLSPL